MFRKYLLRQSETTKLYFCVNSWIRNTHNESIVAITKRKENSRSPIPINSKLIDDLSDFLDHEGEKKSVLEKSDEDLSHVAPYLKPTFNFAAYVNKSETLQQLVKLGVNLHRYEKNPQISEYILTLNFEKDVKNHIRFLYDKGLQLDEIAACITKNPYILKENIEDLIVRINYLQYKKFSDEMIVRILQKNPFWLTFSTQQIDERLGSVQKWFNLSGNEVRAVTVKSPKLITYKMNHIKTNKFVVKEEMGFSDAEVKKILLKYPLIFMKNQNNLLQTFEYMHKTMNISLEVLVEMPQVLTCREFRLKQRYLFLKMLGKLQFDSKQPNYISLLDIVSGDDGYFCTEIAKSSIQAYNAYLKTL